MLGLGRCIGWVSSAYIKFLIGNFFLERFSVDARVALCYCLLKLCRERLGWLDIPEGFSSSFLTEFRSLENEY